MTEDEARQRANEIMQCGNGHDYPAHAVMEDIAVALLRADREATERAMTAVRGMAKNMHWDATALEWTLDAIRRAAGG